MMSSIVDNATAGDANYENQREGGEWKKSREELQ